MRHLYIRVTSGDSRRPLTREPGYVEESPTPEGAVVGIDNFWIIQLDVICPKGFDVASVQYIVDVGGDDEACGRVHI